MPRRRSFLTRLSRRLRSLKEETKAQKREAQKRYRQKPDVKKRTNERIREWQRAHPEVGKAHRAVRWALKTGRLTRPSFCSECFSEGRINGHHESYEPEHRLDVIWLCSICHKKRHPTPPHRTPQGTFKEQS